MSDAHERAELRKTAQAGDDAIDFACQVARIAADQKTEDVSVLDLRGISSLTDFFVIGTGTSDRQMNAVLEHIARHARSIDRRAFNVSNTREASWVLADYVDVVVHLFDERHRAYYDLDGLWGDAPRIEWAGEDSETTSESAG